MLQVGVTGNIGCGKSTVMSLFAKYPDVLCFDADSIAKEILVDTQYREQVIAILGSAVEKDSEIDFAAVAGVIFSNDGVRNQLEDFIHLLLWQKIDQVIDQSKGVAIVVVESAILFEKNLEARFDHIITVYCSEAEQIRRLREDRGMSTEQIMGRMATQMCTVDKVDRADWAISTERELDKIAMHVNIVYRLLHSKRKESV